jgi:hypothetical protein
MANLSASVSMVESIVQCVWMNMMHSGLSTAGKVYFFDCQQIFLPLSHEFMGDKESF